MKRHGYENSVVLVWQPAHCQCLSFTAALLKFINILPILTSEKLKATEACPSKKCLGLLSRIEAKSFATLEFV